MATIATRREQTSNAADTTLLRIMRFLPVAIPMALRIEPVMSSSVLRGGRGGCATVGGTITAGGFGARLTYRRVERGTSLPLEETSSERIALLHHRSLTIQPSAVDRATLGHSPDLWIQYVLGGESPIAPAVRLGACNRGPFDLSPCLPLNLFVDAIVMRGEALDLNPSSDLAIAGDVTIQSGIAARLTLSRSDPSGVPPGQAEAAVDVPLIREGTVIHLPRRPLRSPLGRDSWIYLALLDGTGKVSGGESLLGRAQPGIAGMQCEYLRSLTSAPEPTHLAH